MPTYIVTYPARLRLTVEADNDETARHIAVAAIVQLQRETGAPPLLWQVEHAQFMPEVGQTESGVALGELTIEEETPETP